MCHCGENNALKPLYIMGKKKSSGQVMHNLISFNQLVGTRDNDPHNDLIAEYYECLIECNEDQHICKRICKEVLID